MSENYERLATIVSRLLADTRPASDADIQALQSKLGFELSASYRSYLKHFGVIVAGSVEVYGLGVPEDYYLNVGQAYADLSRDATYPLTAVPLIDDGDGRFYVYDNAADSIMLWATPHGGIVKKVAESLPSFLLSYLQKQ